MWGLLSVKVGVLHRILKAQVCRHYENIISMTEAPGKVWIEFSGCSGPEYLAYVCLRGTSVESSAHKTLKLLICVERSPPTSIQIGHYLSEMLLHWQSMSNHEVSAVVYFQLWPRESCAVAVCCLLGRFGCRSNHASCCKIV
ncbi:hypothetical protein KC358_g26 [Hortaea werneckii]|nr:hypothetical protein KC358_g26 [Hortaea werneckii]